MTAPTQSVPHSRWYGRTGSNGGTLAEGDTITGYWVRANRHDYLHR